uniref:Translocon-associated protein subunit delta n=1 Tax=Rodentolepis nana TaxID=102285 RepID=A0A0R3TW33_RODNA
LNELYAVLGDKIVPVSRNLETDEFQVSFSNDHKKFAKGYYYVRFYDDVGYLSLLKAQTQGQPLDSVKPVFSGIWLSPIIQSETVALLAATLIGFGAVITKNKFFK